jgi:hypothetical protein
MNPERQMHSRREEKRVVLSGKKARQGETNQYTLWALTISAVLAAVIGFVLLTTTEDYTADQPNPLADAPDTNAPPLVPKNTTGGKQG